MRVNDSTSAQVFRTSKKVFLDIAFALLLLSVTKIVWTSLFNHHQQHHHRSYPKERIVRRNKKKKNLSCMYWLVSFLFNCYDCFHICFISFSSSSIEDTEEEEDEKKGETYFWRMNKTNINDNCDTVIPTRFLSFFFDR